VHAMFPFISEAAIAYDLEKSGSVEMTTENILTRGTLDMVRDS
jgi:hypothetical protein